MIAEHPVSNIIVEHSPESVKATIVGRKNRGWFLLTFIMVAVAGLCILPVVGIALINYLSQELPLAFQAIVYFVLFGIYLFILYKKFREVFENIFDKEIVEICERSIKIEKAGLFGLRSRKEFLAQNIKGITACSTMNGQVGIFLYRPLTITGIGAFMIWHSHGFNPFYNFGKGVSQIDAQNLIKIVYGRFPKYRFSGNL
jgi:hypothetical protein